VEKPPPALGYREGGPSTVLRDYGFAYVAPAAQDDSVHLEFSTAQVPLLTPLCMARAKHPRAPLEAIIEFDG
jgi:hypothetical protein